MSEKRPESIATLKALGQAVRAARQARGITLEALAKNTGISKPYLSNIETARTSGPPSDEKLRKLEIALDFPEDTLVQAAHWIRTPASVQALLSPNAPRRADGTLNLDMMFGMPARSAADAGEALRGPALQLAVASVPLINRVAAGRAAEHTNLDYPVGVADAYVPMPEEALATARSVAGEQSGAVFATRVEGHSMSPGYLEGEIVVVCDAPARDGDDCLVRLDEAENFAQTLKRIHYVVEAGKAEPVALRLVPLNRAYAERTVALEQITGIYPVLWKITRVARAAERPAPLERGVDGVAFDAELGNSIAG